MRGGGVIENMKVCFDFVHVICLRHLCFVSSNGRDVIGNSYWASFSAPWDIRNSEVHRDLQVGVVTGEFQRFAQKHEGRLHQHKKTEAIQLLDNRGVVRRLQRERERERERETFELV